MTSSFYHFIPILCLPQHYFSLQKRSNCQPCSDRTLKELITVSIQQGSPNILVRGTENICGQTPGATVLAWVTVFNLARNSGTEENK